MGKLVEPLGFDSLWSVEHHFTPYTMVPDVLKLLSYFAGCTERIEMGTMVIVLPWHDPIRVAEGIATLDNMLAGRRLSIGFGRGLGRREFGALRVPMEESRERFLEALAIVKTALSDEWFSYDGQFTQIPRTTLRPQPRSSGDTLIENMYCAWGSPTTIPIAAETGLKALFIPQTTWDDYAEQMAKFRDLRAQAGFRAGAPHDRLVGVLREGRARGRRRRAAVHPAVRRQRASPLRDRQHTLRDDQGLRALRGGQPAFREAGDPTTWAQMYLNNQVWGTPEQCIEKIARINDLMGPDHFVCIMRYGSMPIDRAEASMRLFATRGVAGRAEDGAGAGGDRRRGRHDSGRSPGRASVRRRRSALLCTIDAEVCAGQARSAAARRSRRRLAAAGVWPRTSRGRATTEWPRDRHHDVRRSGWPARSSCRSTRAHRSTRSPRSIESTRPRAIVRADGIEMLDDATTLRGRFRVRHVHLGHHRTAEGHPAHAHRISRAPRSHTRTVARRRHRRGTGASRRRRISSRSRSRSTPASTTCCSGYAPARPSSSWIASPPADFATLVARYQIRSTVLPPAAMTMLCDDDAVTDLAPLRYVRSITAPLSPLAPGASRDKFGVTVLNGYGQAEMGEVIGWTAADAKAHPEKLGAVGRVHKGVAIKIVDPGGDEVGVDAVGELFARPPNVAAGYAGGGDLGERIDAEGYMRTGDLARIDGDGFVWIEGRLGDVINRGGNKVFPDHVEEVLRLSPRVREVAVVGIPDERLGEVPVAFVVGDACRRRTTAAVPRAPRALQGAGGVPPHRRAAAERGGQGACAAKLVAHIARRRPARRNT